MTSQQTERTPQARTEAPGRSRSPAGSLRYDRRPITRMVVERSRRLIVFAILLPVAAGCAGRADISAVPVSRSDLRDSEPLISRLPTAGRCAWFVDAAGHINVAMKYENVPIFGRFTKAQWLVRIRLGEPPAGRSLKYTILRDHVRGICSSGVEQWRFQSRWGVLVLDRMSGDRFRGRFHLTVAQQQFSLFGGWAPAGPLAPWVLMVGEFEAVHDTKAAKAILDTIDAENWDGMNPVVPTRPVRLTTRPALPRPEATRPTRVRTMLPHTRSAPD